MYVSSKFSLGWGRIGVNEGLDKVEGIEGYMVAAFSNLNAL